MKRLWLVGLIFLSFFSACNESQNEAAKDKIDSLGKKADSTARRFLDTAKEKGKRLKENIEDRFNKDSTNK